jgi:hypothetical protein
MRLPRLLVVAPDHHLALGIGDQDGVQEGGRRRLERRNDPRGVLCLAKQYDSDQTRDDRDVWNTPNETGNIVVNDHAHAVDRSQNEPPLTTPPTYGLAETVAEVSASSRIRTS